MTILAKSLSSRQVHRKAFGANINYAMIMYKEHVQIVTFWFGGISNWFNGTLCPKTDAIDVLKIQNTMTQGKYLVNNMYLRLST